MKIILQKDVAKVGKKYEVKNVASGHALNLLIPRGDAVAATREAMKRLEKEMAKVAGERKVMEDLIAKNIKDLDKTVLTMKGKANDKGHLFAGVHKEEVVKALYEQTKLQVDPSFIDMEHPIKTVGSHMIEVKAAGQSAKFKLVVEAA